MGLGTICSLGSCSDGLSAASAVTTPVRPIPNQVTGRQRGDSDRPVGNNSSGNTMVRKMIGFQIQPDSQAATSGAGSDPGWA